MKAYILIPHDVPLGLAINGAAHAGAALAYRWHRDPAVVEWARESFRKVTCWVDREDLEEADRILATYLNDTPIPNEDGWLKAVADTRIVIRESDLDNQVIAHVYKPRADWPSAFKRFKLYGS